MLKVAHCSVRHMVEGRGAHFQGVQKEQRGALPSVRDMVEESVVHFRVVVFAQRACMVVHHSV